ncbi:MAG: 4-(cytidine 5'-diphospho)-2-C-methyl-D-erythritol kinase [Acidimicrobiia bacterium]
MNSITAVAYAKLTLALHVTGVRDDGYHELDAIVVSISEPADTVTLEFAERDVLAVDGPASPGVPADYSNLAARALAVLRDNAIDVPPLRIALTKVIPHGAGLGGGSADAAAVLVAARTLCGLDLDDMDLMQFGAQLGADVPVCIRGGMTHMTGRGEQVEPLPWGGPFGVVIAVPPFGMSTPAVYREWDALGGPQTTREVRPMETGPALRNDLEPAAESLAPELIGIRESIARVTGYEPLLAGSGSGYACLVADGREARRCVNVLAEKMPQLRTFAGIATPEGVGTI